MMYMRNNNRPKMLPCGTPKVTGRASDNLFSPEVSAVSDYSSTKKTTAKTGGRLQLMTIGHQDLMIDCIERLCKQIEIYSTTNVPSFNVW